MVNLAFDFVLGSFIGVAVVVGLTMGVIKLAKMLWSVDGVDVQILEEMQAWGLLEEARAKNVSAPPPPP
jgi:hypothetical protein